MRLCKWAASAAAAGTALMSSAVAAQNPAEFYKGKTVEIYIGYSTGGGYDVYARLLARHLGKHIPGNPTIVAKNMEGAGSLRLANWIYNAAPKDGTAFGMIGRGTGFDPLLGNKAAQFDANKYNWIGSMNDEVSVCVAWKDAGITKFEELLTKELVVGGTGPSADTDQFPRIMNGVIGTKFKLVSGYPGGNDISLAMQRGEVKGRCGWSWSSVKSTQMQWYKDKTIHVLIQLSLEKHEDLPHVPLVMDYAKTEEQKQIMRLIFARQVMGRPFVAPPDIPADRIATLRRAFMDTMKDKELLAEADKGKLEITAVSGEKVQQLVKETHETPPEVVKQAAELLKVEGGKGKDKGKGK